MGFVTGRLASSTNRRVSLLVALGCALAGCGGDVGSGADGQGDRAGAMPAASSAVTPSSTLVARGRIEIEGGPIALGIQVDGVVASVDVAEGDRVAAGQPLVTTDPTSSAIDVDLAAAHLQVARAQVVELAGDARAAGVRASRLAAAVRADAGDGQSADDARAAAAQATGELGKARAAVTVADAELRQARYASAQHVLRAPEAGQVLRLSVAPGAVVSPQSGALVTLLSDRPRRVRAELGEAIVAAVEPGMQARIVSDDGRQTPLGDARVLRLGSTYGPTRLSDDPQQHTDERAVEAVLSFDTPVRPRIGQRVLVEFAPATAPSR